MSILQWNCNGFHTHLGEIQKIVTETDPEYICLQETRLHETQTAKLSGYTHYRKDRTTNQIASGGVAIYTKNTQYAEEIKLQTNIEAIAISTYTPKKITLCCIYLPPNINMTKTDIAALINQLPVPFIIAGDFNAHNPLWGSSHTDRRGRQIEELIEDDIILLNDGSHTHFCARTGKFTSIDVTLCHPDLAPSLSWDPYPNLIGSDHFPITISSLNSIKQPELHPIYTRWDLKNADWNLFRNLASTTVDYNTLSEDINTLVQHITNHITDAADKAIGRKPTKNKPRTTPWWNPECKKAVYENKRSLYKYRKNMSIENLIELKKTRAKARRIILESKKQSWKSFVSEINPNTPPNKIWNKIQKLKGTKTKQETHILLHGTSVITTPQDIANTLADTFQYNSSDANYSQQFKKYKIQTEKEPIIINDNNNPINSPITITELTDTIKMLNNNTSPGPDGINYEIIKHIPPDTVQQLLNIYNHMWLHNTFPTQWKHTLIIPILKPNKNQTNPQNYRPISLSNCLSKVLQKIINKRLTWYLESRNLLNKTQSGFRQGRSTTDQIINLETEIQHAFRNKQHLIAVLLDIEKAYDTTWKYYIIKSLKEYGLNGHILHYATNYLSNRKFHVKTNGCLSDEKIQKNGVPQGEIISVTLFLIAINKITHNLPRRVKTSLYADDLVIYTRDKNLKTIQELLQTAIVKLDEWSLETGFKFSTQKTKAIHFYKLKRYHPDPILKINNTNIEYTNTVKFLGITFDKTLTWQPHIANIKIECNKRINILKAVSHQKWGGHRHTLLNIYRAIIRSKIDYCCIVYSTAKQTKLRTLNTIQNTAIRICTGAFRTSPIESLLCEAGEPPLYLRRIQLILSYATNLAHHPNNPTHKYLFQTTNNHITPKNITPLQKTINNALTTSKINHFPKISTHSFTKIAPWHLLQPTFHLQLTKYSKYDTTTETYQRKFRELINRFTNYKIIYTDGSKINKETGAAITWDDNTRRYHLPNITSTYTAEAYSIQKSIELANELYPNHKNLAICTDSLSVLQSIKTQYTTNQTVKNIQETIHHEIETNNRNIAFIWIPSHCGIPGNEKADSEAKEAINETLTPIHIPPQDFKNHIKENIKEKWTEIWTQTNNNKLRTIKEDISEWHPSDDRRTQVITTRLRIGHTALTHKYILDKTEPEICNTCNTPITVKHIITDCTKYTTEKHKHKIPDTLKSALSKTEINNTIELLKDIQLLKYI